MSRLLDRFTRLVTARPWLTILLVVIVTVLLAMGATRRAPPAETEDFLPPGSAIGAAIEEIDELFGNAGEVRVVTLVFRGEALTPGGLTQMDTLIDDIVVDPAIGGILAPANPVITPSSLIGFALGTDGFESVTQAQIDGARGIPEIGGALAVMTGIDDDGSEVTVGTIRLIDTGDETVAEAERRIKELATGDEGPLEASSVSFVVIEDEYLKATEEGMTSLIGLALILIAVLTLLFMRSFSDLLLTMLGLIFSIVWVVGAEGWLGPNALGWIGPPSSLTGMVPIIAISLTVDYAIQAVSHYREQRLDGQTVLPAVRTGLRHVAIPLTLAAVTTIVSLLANLFSPIAAIADFGVVAALGVGMSLIVMLTLVPAGRMIIDRRREARGKLKDPRPLAQALPGVERLAEVLGTSVARKPAPYILAVAAVSVGLGFAVPNLKTEFSIRDILPKDGTALRDIETLDSAVGGSTEMIGVLTRAEATETRTLLNIQDLSHALDDESLRPTAAAGPLEPSYVALVQDWTTDSGEPGDKYDAELAALFEEASEGLQLDATLMQEFLDRLGEMDPALAHGLVNNPNGVDTVLLQFPAYTRTREESKLIQPQLEELWLGDDTAITATSPAIIAVTVEDEITERQTEGIAVTIAVAFGVLAIFFWATLRKPILAFIAVAPIVLVLIWVLGTMALLDIPYSLVTSIITALSIGIGVDYTIHVIHRYREEFTRLRNPEQAAIATLKTTGSALLGSALTTAFGFGVMVFSPLRGLQQFAVTAALSIAYSLIVAVLLVPPMMTVWGAYQNMKLRSQVQRMWDDLDVAADEIQASH